MARRSTKNLGILLVLLFIGSLLGSFIGQLLGEWIPILSMGETFGLTPTTLHLGFMDLTFGFTFSLNIAGIIGLLIAFFVYHRM